MAESRQKTHSILLSVDGKNISVETFPADLWPKENTGNGLFRVRINGKWHCPVGKYSFLPLSAVGRLCARFLQGGEPAEQSECPAWIQKGMEVRLACGECEKGMPLETKLAVVKGNPEFGPDGRWWVECRVYGNGLHFVHVDDLEPARKK